MKLLRVIQGLKGLKHKVDSTILDGVKVLVFDVGNVIFPFYEEIVVKRLLPHCSGKNFNEVFQGVFRSPIYRQFMYAYIDSDQYHESIAKNLGLALNEDEFFEIFKEVYQEPNQEMLKILYEASRAGYKISLFTDMDWVLYEHLTKRHSWIEKLGEENIVASCMQMALKSDPEQGLFEAVEIAASVLEGSEILFFDDRICNICTGIARGWKTVHYRAPNAPIPPDEQR